MAKVMHTESGSFVVREGCEAFAEDMNIPFWLRTVLCFGFIAVWMIGGWWLLYDKVAH
jgi:hypothetical protein